MKSFLLRSSAYLGLTMAITLKPALLHARFIGNVLPFIIPASAFWQMLGLHKLHRYHEGIKKLVSAETPSTMVELATVFSPAITMLTSLMISNGEHVKIAKGVRFFSLITQIGLVAYFIGEQHKTAMKYVGLLNDHTDEIDQMLDSFIHDAKDWLPSNSFVCATKDESRDALDKIRETNMIDKFRSDKQAFRDVKQLFIAHYDFDQCISSNVNDYVQQFPDLEHLKVTCYNAHSFDISNQGNSHLKALTLDTSAKDINKGVGSIWYKYKELERLNISSDFLDEKGIEEIARSPNLEEFQLTTFRFGLPEGTLDPFANHDKLKEVRVLTYDMDRCNAIMDELTEARSKTGKPMFNVTKAE